MSLLLCAAMRGRRDPALRALLIALGAVGCATYGPEVLDSGASEPSAGGAAGMPGAGAGAASGSDGGSTLGGRAGGGATAGTGAVGGSAVDTSKAYVTGGTEVPPISVDLTSEGFRDWAHWGLKSAEDYNHKADVPSSLLDFKPLGSVAPKLKAGGPTTFKWSDGTPVANASTLNGISWIGLDQGFQLDARAADEELNINLYIGVTAGAAEIRATLSDPDATSALEDQISSPVGSWNLRMLNVRYGFAVPGSVLTITLKVVDALDETAAVSLNGVAFGAP